MNEQSATSQPLAETSCDANTDRQRIDLQTTWLLQALNDINGSGELARYLVTRFALSEQDQLFGYVVRAVYKGKCPAKTKPQFIRWAKRQLDRKGGDILPHVLAQRIRQQTGMLRVSDVLNIARVHQVVREGTPPFPQVVQNGNVALVDTGKHILKIPACPDSDDPAANFLTILQALWPWHERGRKIFKNSSWEDRNENQNPFRIPLHRLFLAFVDNDPKNDGRIVRAKNGDFLDWTKGNLYFSDEAKPKLIGVQGDWELDWAVQHRKLYSESAEKVPRNQGTQEKPYR